MRRHLILLVALFLLLITVQAAVAQQPYTEGPIWRVMFIRLKPGHTVNEYLASFKKFTFPAVQQEKKQKLILGFKILLNNKKADPQDWDILVAYQFKDQPSFNSFVPKEAAIELKDAGGKEGHDKLTVDRAAMKDTIRVAFVREITLK